MKIRFYSDESIAIVDSLVAEPNSQFVEYELNDEGCQAINCTMKKPKQGHNGGCSCFKHIPFKIRGIVRQLVEENSTGLKNLMIPMDSEILDIVNNNFLDMVDIVDTPEFTNYVYCSLKECNGWYWGICQKQPATVCLLQTNKRD